MVLINSGDKICHPLEVREIRVGNIIVIEPIQVVINNKFMVFPPLSLISESCVNEIRYPVWVNGYRVKGDEEVRIIEGNEEIYGELYLHEPSLLTGYSLIKLLGEKLKLRLNKEYNKGLKILSISNYPLVLIENSGKRVTVTSQDYEILFKLFAYSIFYYTRSSSDEV
ncbi:MAG: hypothetical protein QXV69_03025 [Sulfolobaceae archaeon]